MEVLFEGSRKTWEQGAVRSTWVEIRGMREMTHRRGIKKNKIYNPVGLLNHAGNGHGPVRARPIA